MGETATKGLTPLARLALVLIVVFLVTGFYWYGFDAETRNRMWSSSSSAHGKDEIPLSSATPDVALARSATPLRMRSSAAPRISGRC